MEQMEQCFSINPLIRLYTILIYTNTLLFTYLLNSLFHLFHLFQYGARSQCLCGFEGCHGVEQEARKVEQMERTLSR